MCWFHGGSHTNSTSASSTPGNGQNLGSRILSNRRTHPTAGSSQRHLDFHLCAGILRSHDLAIVNQTEIHNVYRNFGIVHRAELVPDFLLVDLFSGFFTLLQRTPWLEPKGTGIFFADPKQAVVASYRVAPAETLRDDDPCSCRNCRFQPSRDLYRLAIPFLIRFRYCHSFEGLKTIFFASCAGACILCSNVGAPFF